MALIICSECGKKVSDSAKTCIHCGAPLSAEETAAKTAVPEKKEEPEKKIGPDGLDEDQNDFGEEDIKK